MSDHEEYFIHSPLPSAGPGQKPFRLLSILPADRPDEPLKCTLYDADLSSKPDFKALSYVCGPQNPKVLIQVNDCRYTVTQNCHAALLRCRELGQTPLWVDSICIHQTNNQEKGVQILLMKDIYPQASQVVVWLCHWNDKDEMKLDEAAEELAIALVKDLAEVDGYESFMEAAMRSSYELNSKVVGSWSSLTMLLQHQWFTRLWTFQEIVLSTDALLVLNNHTMPYSTLSTAVEKSSVFINGRRQIYTPFLAPEIRDLFLNVCGFIGNRAVARWQQPSILYQLKTTREDQCFDARDRVFASLGLLDEKARAGIVVDYTKSIVQVYANATKVAVETLQDLKAIAVAGLYHSQGQEEVTWPSWIFDWRKNALEQPQWREYALYKAAMSTVPTVSFGDDCLSVTARGILFDTIIDSLPEPEEDLLSMRHSLEYTWAAKGLSLWHSHFSAYPTNEDPVSTWLSTITNDLSLSSQSEPRARRSAFVIAAHKLFYSTRFSSARDFDNKGFEAVFSPRGHSRQSWQQEIQDAVYNFGQAIEYAVNKRTFFITRKGYMGFGPLGLRRGDQVCVLKGCSVPLVIRAMEGGAWILVGDSFVSGLMDGEAMKTGEGETPPWEDFKIV